MRKILLIIFLLIFLIGGFLIYDKIIIQLESENESKNLTSQDVNKKIIILVYHRLVKDNEVDEEKFKLKYEGAPYLYSRKESQFINDMEYIKKSDYEVISLYDLLEIQKRRRNLKSNAVIITFDDGAKNQYDIAFPILKQYGFKATFFVITNKVSQEGHMSWENLREMANFNDKDGSKHLFDIESHSHTHPNLALKKETETERQYKKRIWSELQLSQEIIQEEIKKNTRFLALPFGGGGRKGEEKKFSLIKKLAKECGYYGIRTSNRGTVNIYFDDMYKLNTLPVLNRTEISKIKTYLEKIK